MSCSLSPCPDHPAEPSPPLAELVDDAERAADDYVAAVVELHQAALAAAWCDPRDETAGVAALRAHRTAQAALDAADGVRHAAFAELRAAVAAATGGTR